MAADPQVQRDVPYAEPKNERQTLDIYYSAEGTELGQPGDKSSEALFDFLKTQLRP